MNIEMRISYLYYLILILYYNLVSYSNLLLFVFENRTAPAQLDQVLYRDLFVVTFIQPYASAELYFYNMGGLSLMNPLPCPTFTNLYNNLRIFGSPSYYM